MVEDLAREPADLFRGFPASLAICRRVQDVVSSFGDVAVAVTRSQVALRRRKAFAYVWRPGQYVSSDVPAVVSLALPREIASDRFKEVVHPSPKVWMHHVELRDPSEVDEELRAWLAEAWSHAG